MKKSRLLLLLATTALGAGMLSGCGQDVKDTGQVIILWSTFNDTYQTVINNAIKTFKKAHPEYTVKNVKQNGSYDDLKNMAVKGAAGGDYPDLIIAYPDSVADFITAGIARDITPLMEDEEIGWTEADLNDIPKGYIEEGQNYAIPGTYSLPICKSTEAMFYNREILVGLDLSDIDDEINDGDPLTDEYIQSLTWDELLDKLCPAIMEYNDKQPADKKILVPSADYQSTWGIVGYDSDDNLFITLAEQYGLPYTSIDQETGAGSVDFVEKDDQGRFKDVLPGYMNLMKKLAKAYEKKYFTTTGTIGKRANYVFTTGGMLFSIGSTGGVKYQYNDSDGAHQDVGVAPIPQVNTSNAKAINQGPSVAFLDRGATEQIRDSHAKGAWLLYKEWTGKSYATQWAMTTGYAPIRKSVSESQEFINYSNPDTKKEKSLEKVNALTARYVAKNIDSLFSSPVYSGSSKARTGVGGIIATIFKDGHYPLDGDESKMRAFEKVVKDTFEKGYSNSI